MDALANAAPAPVAAPLEEPKESGPRGTPDLSLAKAVEAIQRSRWAKNHGATRDDVIQELRDKLSLGSLDVWGETKHSGRIQWGISPDAWGLWELDPAANAATYNGEQVLTRVQFSSAYVRLLWPPAGTL